MQSQSNANWDHRIHVQRQFVAELYCLGEYLARSGNLLVTFVDQSSITIVKVVVDNGNVTIFIFDFNKEFSGKFGELN